MKFHKLAAVFTSLVLSAVLGLGCEVDGVSVIGPDSDSQTYGQIMAGSHMDAIRELMVDLDIPTYDNNYDDYAETYFDLNGYHFLITYDEDGNFISQSSDDVEITPNCICQ